MCELRAQLFDGLDRKRVEKIPRWGGEERTGGGGADLIPI